MIPVRLQLRGFLSYKEPIDLSFDDFDLACICGDNGAGKSSLLDAITWVLFGKARRNDDGVINNTCSEAEVVYQFVYENTLYRVQRIKARNRPVVLEFQAKGEEENWKVLSERSVADTQRVIHETLHLDYDTFINASFFLQGKADEFTQKNSTARKEILAGILGMDVWERYKDFTREVRRNREDHIKVIEGSLKEIDDELAQEEQRRQSLKQAQATLDQLETQRKEQQHLYDQANKITSLLHDQRKTRDEAQERHGSLQAGLKQDAQQIDERQQEEEHLVQVVNAAEQIEQDYKARIVLVGKLQKLDELSRQYFLLQQKQASLEKSVAIEESRLKQELLTLEKEKNKIQHLYFDVPELEKKKEQYSAELLRLQKNVDEQNELKKELEADTLQKSSLQAENKTLRETMQKLKERMDRLQQESGSICPLCGQPLSEEHRKQVLVEITAEGQQNAALYHKNEELIQQLQNEILACEQQITSIDDRVQQTRGKERELGALESDLNRMRMEISEWEQTGINDLKMIGERLTKNDFAGELRDQEAAILREMEALGYDAALHDSIRKEEQTTRAVEQSHQEVVIAANRLEPLRREINTLRARHQSDQQELETLAKKLKEMDGKIQETEDQLPDVEGIGERLNDIIVQENQQRAVVGGATQLVSVIETQKERRKKIREEMKTLLQEQANLLMLERDFGRDGVQALLIEEALPQMQMQANEILRNLSSGSMSVTFRTEREYKDKKRDDKMQVLDILISDAEGVQRPYDLYSGGEAFRINFAIRLALSKVLAQRAGARLQMLVIDEGFGSQDAEGRQKLIEAINLIRPDFKKILVITHLEELKDAFPARIEVSKTRKGSQVEVIVQ